jgi:multisubunit Na+/H+ antiporter MnhB subunit
LREQNIRELRPASQAGTVALLIVGIALVLIGQFILDKLADTSDTWHWFQHGVLFGGGVAVGVAATRLYLAGRLPA